ncbi:MAG: hypothetical protein AAAFM81_14980 [Pseudomonadota bacterium]
MPLDIQLVKDRDQERAVRRFWYEIYVEEMGRHAGQSSYVDHTERELANPWNFDADLFMATQHGEIVGTLQSAYVGVADCSHYIDFYRLAEQSVTRLARASITSKLMVSKTHRASGLAIALGLATYRKGLSDGIEQNYIDCNSHLVRLYTRIGYREHLGWIEHPDYGRVYSMVLDLRDRAHLEAIHSPLLKTLDDFNLKQTLDSKESINDKVA